MYLLYKYIHCAYAFYLPHRAKPSLVHIARKYFSEVGCYTLMPGYTFLECTGNRKRLIEPNLFKPAYGIYRPGEITTRVLRKVENAIKEV